MMVSTRQQQQQQQPTQESRDSCHHHHHLGARSEWPPLPLFLLLVFGLRLELGQKACGPKGGASSQDAHQGHHRLQGNQRSGVLRNEVHNGWARNEESEGEAGDETGGVPEVAMAP